MGLTVVFVAFHHALAMRYQGPQDRKLFLDFQPLFYSSRVKNLQEVRSKSIFFLEIGNYGFQNVQNLMLISGLKGNVGKSASEKN